MIHAAQLSALVAFNRNPGTHENKIWFLCHYTIDIDKRNWVEKSQIRANNGKTSSNFQKYHTKSFPCSFLSTFLYLFWTIAPILIDFPQLALHRSRKVSVHSVDRVCYNCTQHNCPSPNNSVIIKNCSYVSGVTNNYNKQNYIILNTQSNPFSDRETITIPWKYVVPKSNLMLELWCLFDNQSAIPSIITIEYCHQIDFGNPH